MTFYIGGMELFSQQSEAENLALNSEIIEKWNQKVSPKDEVYVLGDVCKTYSSDIWDVLLALNGRKYLAVLPGDMELVDSWQKLSEDTRKAVFEDIAETYLIVDGEIPVFVAPMPHADWPYSENGTVHVYSWFKGDCVGYSSQFMTTLKGALNAHRDSGVCVPKTLRELNEQTVAKRSFLFSPVTGLFQ